MKAQAGSQLHSIEVNVACRSSDLEYFAAGAVPDTLGFQLIDAATELGSYIKQEKAMIFRLQFLSQRSPEARCNSRPLGA